MIQVYHQLFLEYTKLLRIDDVFNCITVVLQYTVLYCRVWETPKNQRHS